MFKWLQEWYKLQCEKDWEPSISLITIDNPGWRLKIDLRGTEYSGLTMKLKKIDITESDWYQCWIENNIWNAACGTLNLEEIIGEFRAFINSQKE